MVGTRRSVLTVLISPAELYVYLSIYLPTYLPIHVVALTDDDNGDVRETLLRVWRWV